MMVIKLQYTLLVILYFLEGVPFGLQTIVIPLNLRKLNYELWEISLFHILSLPWLLKFIVAPCLNIKGPKWIAICIMCMGLNILSIDFTMASRNTLLIIALLGNSVLAALLDVMVDGLALQWFTENTSIGKNLIFLFLISGNYFSSWLKFLDTCNVFFVQYNLNFRLYLLALN